jgi:hypothetical protein
MEPERHVSNIAYNPGISIAHDEYETTYDEGYPDGERIDKIFLHILKKGLA